MTPSPEPMSPAPSFAGWLSALHACDPDQIRHLMPSPERLAALGKSEADGLALNLNRLANLAELDAQVVSAVAEGLPVVRQLAWLHQAIRAANPTLVAQLLERPTVQAALRASEDGYELTLAAREGDLVLLNLLLPYRSGPEAVRLAMVAACERGHDRVVALLAAPAAGTDPAHQAVLIAMRHPHAAAMLPHLLPREDLDDLVATMVPQMSGNWGMNFRLLTPADIDGLALYAQSRQWAQWLSRFGADALPQCAAMHRAHLRQVALAERPAEAPARLRRRS